MCPTRTTAAEPHVWTIDASSAESLMQSIDSEAAALPTRTIDPDVDIEKWENAWSLKNLCSNDEM